LAYGGVLMILPYIGGSAAMHEKGRKVITQALVGILIIFFAWLGIDTIIKVIASPSITNPRQPGELFGLFPGKYLFPWNKIECERASSSGEELPSCTPEPPEIVSCSGIDCEGYVDGYPESTLAMQESEPPEGTSIDLKEADELCAGISFDEETTDAISAAAQKYGISTARIKAVIIAESSGKSDATHTDRDGMTSYGYMQVRYDTATIIEPGLSSSDLQRKLLSKPGNIDIGTNYYKQMRDKYGNDDLAAAAYNGGPGANKNSVNCASEGKKRWQCEWDNNEHTLPNERSGHPGYGVTRRYIPRIAALEQQINSGACNP